MRKVAGNPMRRLRHGGYGTLHSHAAVGVVPFVAAVTVLAGAAVGASVVIIAAVMIAVVVVTIRTGSVASRTVLQWRKRGGFVSRHTA